LRFPKKNKEERYPLKKTELRDIVLTQARYPKRQALYLACSSSGMRIGEALSIRKKDLDFTQERIMVRIRAEYTKTRQARTTFLSKECEERIRTYLNTLGDDELVFTNSTKDVRSTLEQNALRRALERLGLTEKYTTNGFYKITTHSFRAYFFTIAARKHGENYAHKLTGHGGYLMQYDRMTDEEKLKMYLELEPELVVFDQTKNELEIRRLKEENQTIEELKDEVKKLREYQAQHDKRLIQEMKDNGIIIERNDKSIQN
jgi:integrase